jgi:hypothetical protein
LDDDLADLYEVETKALNRAVKRNRDRFPEDFMFQLTAEEFADLRFQSGTSAEEKAFHWVLGVGGEMKQPVVQPSKKQVQAAEPDAAIAANLEELGYGG